MTTSDNPRSLTQRYLDELYRRLNRLPEPERREAVREIASHVAEATANGRPTAAILAQLGSPEALARVYVGDYFLQRHAAGFIGKAARLLIVAAVALGSGFATLVVVPTLALTSIGFGVAADTVGEFDRRTSTPSSAALRSCRLISEAVRCSTSI
jgi:uncharacterized membrane protein